MGVLARPPAFGGQVAPLRLGTDGVIAYDPAVVQQGQASAMGGSLVRPAEQNVGIGHCFIAFS